jgi:hypothetical protein
MQGQNQRRSVRILEENSLSVTTIGGSPKALQVMSKDISETGVRVRTPDFIAVNTRLTVEIRFSTPPRSITLNGIVRWVRELGIISMYEAGIEFDNVDDETADLLARYVSCKGRD